MSAIHLTENERLKALARFGYSQIEARFLTIAALHSGYFLRRQAEEFLHRNSDSSAPDMIEKVFRNNHATAVAYDRNTHLYHLCTRPFYAALGEEDNRNRRVRECSTIKNKLMALDFVLAQKDVRFLATECEKMLHFTGTLGVTESCLPCRTYSSAKAPPTKRYFVEKYPIFLPSTGDNFDSVSFCFIDEGLTTPCHFETFLGHYARLFSALSRFHLIYVAARTSPFRWAESTFQEHRMRHQSDRPDDLWIWRLTAYFALRQRYDDRDFDGLDRAKLRELRNGRIEFSHPRYAALYEVWKTGGDMAVRQVLTPKSPNQLPQTISFSTYLLEHNYDFLGSLTSI
jgi:hypothetical protein